MEKGKDRRKELIRAYKERELLGGVYRIKNMANGRYLLSHAIDLQGSKNLFDFSVATGSAMQHKLTKDWKEFGAQAFAFEVLEELKSKPDQTLEEFAQDLELLEQLWREKLDLTLEY